MDAIGSVLYWAARFAAYVAHNLARGWYWERRTDYDEPMRWNVKPH